MTNKTIDNTFKNEDIDSVKVGEFLRQLRKENNISQQELADKLFVSRQAVSLWELGKTLPDYDSALLVSNYYKISIADLFAGKYLKNKEEQNKIVNKVIKKEIKKSKKIIIGFIILNLLLVFAFLVYYFVNSYNSIKVYIISNADENYQIDGTITKSVNDIYFNLQIDKIASNLCLLYNDVEIACHEDTNFIMFKEKLGQRDFINVKSFDDYLNNLYVKINDNTIKLNITKDYQNDKLLFQEEENISSDEYNYNFEENVPLKIKEIFKYDEDENKYYYIFKYNNKVTTLEYYLNIKNFIIKEDSKKLYMELSYDCRENKVFSYKEINNNKIVYNLTNFPDMSSSNELKKIFEYFESNYLVKYIY